MRTTETGASARRNGRSSSGHAPLEPRKAPQQVSRKPEPFQPNQPCMHDTLPLSVTHHTNAHFSASVPLLPQSYVWPVVFFREPVMTFSFFVYYLTLLYPVHIVAVRQSRLNRINNAACKTRFQLLPCFVVSFTPSSIIRFLSPPPLYPLLHFLLHSRNHRLNEENPLCLPSLVFGV